MAPIAKVLLVEDDVELREILVDTLMRQGLVVAEAENGLAGKILFDSDGESFDLIVTDVQMPHLNGVDLLKHIRTITEKPVILMSGYSQDLDAQDPKQLGATAFLAKPFRADMLVSAITECLKLS